MVHVVVQSSIDHYQIGTAAKIERLGKDYRSNQNGGRVGTPTQQRRATAHNLRDTGGVDIGTRAFARHGARATTR